MKKHILSFSVAVLCLLSAPAFANVITGQAAIPDGYYNSVNGQKSPDNILNALNGIIDGHTVIAYKGLEPYYEQTDFYSDTLWDMYSTCRFTMDDANKQQSKVCDGWNKEHVCCQSWLGSGPMVSDLFNVYPTDARINNLRSNYPYGVVASNKGFSSDPHNHGLGKLGTSAISGGGETVYEPDDRYKGDFARTFFYMVARYRKNTLDEGNGSKMFSRSPTNLTSYSLSFLLKWHREDPVSEKEIDRNEAVYGIQHNRNPFIDYPELVEYVWGDKKGQMVDLSALTPTSETIVPPTPPTPPVTVDQFYITWFVNGEIIRIDTVGLDALPDSIPAEPTSCAEYNAIFVGWTDTPFSGILESEPESLWTIRTQFPETSDNVTYFAVFAQEKEEAGEGTSKTTVNFSGYKRGNKVTTEKAGEITVTFAKGTAANEATYYSEVRSYPSSTITISGAQITKIEFISGQNDKGNALTPNVGTMVDNSTWKGNAESVTFTVEGDNGYRGIKAIDVFYGEQATVKVLTGYRLSCDGEPVTPIDPPGPPDEGIEEIEASPTSNGKILIGTQLYIKHNGHIFTLTGQEVK